MFGNAWHYRSSSSSDNNIRRRSSSSLTSPMQYTMKNKKNKIYKKNMNLKQNKFKISLHNWKHLFWFIFIVIALYMTYVIINLIQMIKKQSYIVHQPLPSNYYDTLLNKPIITLDGINKNIFSTHKYDIPKFNVESFNKSNDWKFTFYNDSMMRSSLFDIYHDNKEKWHWIQKIKFPVELADLWRYSILYEYGGLYVDSDVYLLEPIQYWFYNYDYTINNIPVNQKSAYQLMIHSNDIINIDMVIGIENDKSFNGNPLQFTQWTILSKQNSILLKNIIEHVFQNMKLYEPIQTNIQKRTGPIVWTEGILNYISEHSRDLNGKNKNGKPNVLLNRKELDKKGQIITLYPNYNDNDKFYVAILPYRAFNQCRIYCEKVKDIHQILVQHQFSGKWKNALNHLFG